jgi:hypothetical protein
VHGLSRHPWGELAVQPAAVGRDARRIRPSIHTKEFIMSISLIPLHHIALVTAGSLLCAFAALAATPAALTEAQARYRQEMALCNSGQSNQDIATCREEAQHALAEARRGGLDDVPSQYEKNAVQRCEALKGDDRSDCVARMRGEGSVEGSVAGGGILRQSVTVVPAK